MKAAVFKAVGTPLAVESSANPTPGKGEAVIKVGRCGICMSDVHMTAGHGFTYPSGSILGHEYAGEVVELGTGVTHLKIGDRVTAMPTVGCGTCAECLRGFPLGCASLRSFMSGYAQYAMVAESTAIKLPTSLSLADGALIEPLASSLRGVAMSGIRPGSDVAVLGAGTIGLGAIYWARRMGAGRILVIARSERNRELAMRMGATHFHAQGGGQPAPAGVGLGRSPEIVFECIGAPGALALATDLVAPRGTIVVLGMCMTADSVTPFFAGFKSIVMKFSAAYELRDFETAADAMDRGGIEPRSMITETIPLDELPTAFEQLRAGPRGCKIMVNPGV